MKFVRVITVAVFLLSVVIWGIGKYHAMNTDKVPPVIESDSDEIHVKTKTKGAIIFIKT